MRRIGFGVMWAFVGYVCGGFVGSWLVIALSSNTFDREVEAATTGAFVTGPIAAVVAFVIGVWRAAHPVRDRGPA